MNSNWWFYCQVYLRLVFWDYYSLDLIYQARHSYYDAMNIEVVITGYNTRGTHNNNHYIISYREVHVWSHRTASYEFTLSPGNNALNKPTVLWSRFNNSTFIFFNANAREACCAHMYNKVLGIFYVVQICINHKN